MSNRRGCELRVLKFTDSGNSDHEPSIKAIIAGLVQRDSNTFLIHLGGTGVVADWQSPDYLGRLNPKIWSDIENIDEITSLPDEALHRNVDKIILDAGVRHSNKLKTAICCPPDIYGPGRGPGRTSSVYCPVFVEEIKKTGSAFYANEGTNTRSWVHIEDLMTIYLKLVEAAVVGGGNANWGKDVFCPPSTTKTRNRVLNFNHQGYYFASSQEASQVDIARATAKILQKHGIIQTSEPKQLSLDQVDAKMSRFGVPHIASYMFAANSRTRADRATTVLGYKPSAPSLWDALEADLLASQ